MIDDFRNAPVSVTEYAAERDADSRKWTPRDVLVSLLRDIDSGAVSAKSLVVVYRRINVDGLRTSWMISGDGIVEAQGMMMRAIHLMNAAD